MHRRSNRCPIQALTILAAAIASTPVIGLSIDGSKFHAEQGARRTTTSCVADSYAQDGETYDAAFTIYSYESDLCTDATTGGRVRYFGIECEDGNILWTYSVTIDHGDGFSDCTFDWTVHASQSTHGGSCGVAPTVSGGDQLPMSCSAFLDTTTIPSPDHEFDFQGCSDVSDTADTGIEGAGIVATAVNGAACSNEGIMFDGVDDYVDINSWQFGGEALTIEAFVKFGAFNLWSRIFDFGNGEYGDEVFLAHQAETGVAQFTVRVDSTGYSIHGPSPFFMVDEWIQIVITVEGTTMKIYKDGGTLLFSSANGKEPSDRLRANHWLGRSQFSVDGYFEGTLKSLRFWHGKALNADVVAELYSEHTSPTQSPTTAGDLGGLLKNGGFEVGYTGLTFAQPGFPTGWRGDGRVLIRTLNPDFGGLAAPSGSYFLGLKPAGARILQNATSTLPFGAYELSFLTAYRPSIQPDGRPYACTSLRVKVEGDTILVDEVVTVTSIFKSHLLSFDAIQNGTVLTVIFENLCVGEGDTTVFLDGVALIDKNPSATPTLRPTPFPTIVHDPDHEFDFRGCTDRTAWVFPSSQISYYFATATDFVLPSSEWTIETWIKPYTVSTDGKAVWLSWGVSGNTNCIRLLNSAFTSANVWYYVTVTWDGSNMILYVNGVATTTGIEDSFCGSYTGCLVFGQDQDGDSPGTTEFEAIDAPGMEQHTVAVYSVAWSPADVPTAKSSVSRSDSTLYALWINSSLDETGNGNTATVSSSGAAVVSITADTGGEGAGITATAVNGATCSSEGMVFDGVDDYVDVTPWEIGGEPMTVEVFAKVDMVSSSNLLFNFVDTYDDWDDSIHLANLAAGTNILSIRQGTSETKLTVDDFWVDSSWTHVVCTVDDTTMACYKNGTLLGSTGAGQEPLSMTRAYHRIGMSMPNGVENKYFDGTIAYLRFWHGVALDAGQVAQLHLEHIKPTTAPTAGPTEAPTNGPTNNSSTFLTTPPSRAPTIPQNLYLRGPSIAPTPQPSVVVFGAISAEAVEAVAAAAAAAVGASVGGSVGASVGGSAGGSAGSGGGGGGGGSGGGGSGSSSPTGDPLSLIFLVQAIAITRNIASMPTTYTKDFAGSFAMFNLQMAPPSWAKSVLDTSAWAPNWLFNENRAGTTIRNHFFYNANAIFWLLVCHLSLVYFVNLCGFSMPKFLAFPTVEVIAFMALSMGMLDVGAEVLTDHKAALGWRAIGCLYVGTSIYFVYWFWGKGKRFAETCEWKPNRNCKQMKLFLSLDANSDGKISLDELLAGGEKLGKNLTREQIIQLFQDCDTSGDGYIDEAEFLAHFKKQRISWEETTVLEGIWTLLVASRRQSGCYVVKDAYVDLGIDVNHPWGRFFNKFAPAHKNYYLKGIGRSFLETFTLNGLKSLPAMQVGIMAAAQYTGLYQVVASSPYTLLAQTRAEIFANAMKCVTYTVALFPLLGWLSPTDASELLIQAQFLSLLHSIYTQMYPQLVMLGPLCVCLLDMCARRFCPVNKEERKKEHEAKDAKDAVSANETFYGLKLKHNDDCHINPEPPPRVATAPKRLSLRYVEAEEDRPVEVVSVKQIRTPDPRFVGSEPNRSTRSVRASRATSRKMHNRVQTSREMPRTATNRPRDNIGSGKSKGAQFTKRPQRPSAGASNHEQHVKSKGPPTILQGQRDARHRKKFALVQPVHDNAAKQPPIRLQKYRRSEGTVSSGAVKTTRHEADDPTPIGRSLDAPLTPHATALRM